MNCRTQPKTILVTIREMNKQSMPHRMELVVICSLVKVCQVRTSWRTRSQRNSICGHWPLTNYKLLWRISNFARMTYKEITLKVWTNLINSLVAWHRIHWHKHRRFRGRVRVNKITIQRVTHKIKEMTASMVMEMSKCKVTSQVSKMTEHLFIKVQVNKMTNALRVEMV